MASTYCTRTIRFHRAKRWCRAAVWNATLPHIIFVQDGSISCSMMRCNWHGVEMFVGLRPIVSMLLLLPPNKAQIKSFGYLLLHTMLLYYNSIYYSTEQLSPTPLPSPALPCPHSKHFYQTSLKIPLFRSPHELYFRKYHSPDSTLYLQRRSLPSHDGGPQPRRCVLAVRWWPAQHRPLRCRGPTTATRWAPRHACPRGPTVLPRRRRRAR